MSKEILPQGDTPPSNVLHSPTDMLAEGFLGEPVLVAEEYVRPFLWTIVTVIGLVVLMIFWQPHTQLYTNLFRLTSIVVAMLCILATVLVRRVRHVPSRVVLAVTESGDLVILEVNAISDGLSVRRLVSRSSLNAVSARAFPKIGMLRVSVPRDNKRWTLVLRPQAKTEAARRMSGLLRGS